MNSDYIPDWVTSDQHFYHKNIVKYCYRPGWVEEDYIRHNDIMLIRWNHAVGPDDKVLHLGDLCFKKTNNKERLEHLLKRLNGDITIILGNHDKNYKEWYQSLGFKVIQPFFIMESGYKVYFTHYPKRELQSNEMNIHGHIHNNSVGGLTSRHKNVSVEVTAFSPLPYESILGGMLYRAKNAQPKDFDD